MTDDDPTQTVTPTPFLTDQEIEAMCAQFAAALASAPETPEP